MSSKKLSIEALNAIQKGSEVVEKTNNEEEQINNDDIVRRKRPRKQYRNFSVNFEIDDYNKFQIYLNENGINSGSGFIRELLKENGII
ncbi:hypothetical protein CCORG_a0046 (plasmid) [Campylobacter corcagiensis]|uniref:Uncharacterized protein n=2 Tax=Campylobacter corcagiensis TaxID=1448857 RepID=A0A6M8N3I5_9BACT|nr:hypothetical protein [Campylobacter corcagiensis]QKF65538.1 hypothetical protein CCORG_a0002 [Campylobacter corcagiensis]QKF65582.1 hypothetical protein CCORG_a0046 [Campylobacter corcagiensis]